MIRKFVCKSEHGDKEYSEINTDTGELRRWMQDGELIYSEWEDNVIDMGWKSVDEFIKNRRNKASGWVEVTG